MGFFSWLFKRNKPQPKKLGLALGSGGAKGYAELGVLRAFEENGVEFSVVAGTSIGSIIGAFYADGYSSTDILELLNQVDFSNVLTGIPINMDGTEGFQAQNCIDFAQKILGFDIIFEDERLTSEEAEQRLRSRKIDFRKNKGLVDMESACVILEQYLSRK